MWLFLWPFGRCPEHGEHPLTLLPPMRKEGRKEGEGGEGEEGKEGGERGTEKILNGFQE